MSNYVVKDGDKWYQMNPSDAKTGDECLNCGEWKFCQWAHGGSRCSNKRRRLIDPGTGYRILGLEETITQHYECMDVYSPEWKKYFRPEPTVKVKDYIGDSGILAIRQRIPAAAVSSEPEWPKYWEHVGPLRRIIYKELSDNSVSAWNGHVWMPQDWTIASERNMVHQITPAKMLELTGQKPEPKPIETTTELAIELAGKIDNLTLELSEVTKERDALQKEIKEFWNPPMAQALENVAKEVNKVLEFEKSKAHDTTPRLPKPGEPFVVKYHIGQLSLWPFGVNTKERIESLLINSPNIIAWTSLSSAVWITPHAPVKEKDVVEKYLEAVGYNYTAEKAIRDFLKFQSSQKPTEEKEGE